MPGTTTRTRGFSLVELMVALLLGLILTAGMIQLFNGSKATFSTNDALARVQENGRFALEILKRELRESGTHGFCAAQLNIRNHVAADPLLDEILDIDRPIIGWEFTGTGRGANFSLPADLTPPGGSGGWAATDIGALPAGLVGQIVPGSDVLVMRRVVPIPLLTAGGSSTNSIDLVDKDGNSTNHGLEGNPVALVTDCASGADLFRVNNPASSTSFNIGGGTLSTTYGEGMQAFELVITAYYVGLGADGEPALFALDLGRNIRQELVAGVENMQVLYGFSRAAPQGDGQSVNDWITASEIPADGWGQVISLRVGFGARSPEAADTNRAVQTFDLAETNIQSQGDGRMRHGFSATVALRNQLLVF